MLPHLHADHHPLVVESDWLRLFDDTPAALRQAVRDTVIDNAPALADAFYTRMLDDEEARPFLAHDTVQTRLKGSMQRWLHTLFACEDRDSFSAAMAMQRHVGEVHARIDLPVNIVARGARVLKGGIARALLNAELERSHLVEATLYAGALIDIAFEVMSSAYVASNEQNSRVDEAYRVFASGQNMMLEKERQRAALLDWENQFLFAMAAQHHGDELPRLAEASYGLWLQHKASTIFQGASELGAILTSIQRIDEVLIPQCQTLLRTQQLDALRGVIRDVQTELSQQKYLLGNLFERFLNLESGKDPLTQLLNRRFLPAIMVREIELSRRQHKPFAVLLVDVDHFKRVNDQYGHEAGDRVLQQVAALLLNNVRAGDFLFRYGGEEFLILLVEVDISHAARVAEKIRSRVAQDIVTLPDQRQLSVSVSIGLALHDGHPDYQHLIARADEALYAAKNQGRNRVVMAA